MKVVFFLVLVKQEAGRPAPVAELLPQLELDVDQHRVGDLQARHRRLDRLGITRWLKAGGVGADHPQAGILVALVPGLHVRLGADRVPSCWCSCFAHRARCLRLPISTFWPTQDVFSGRIWVGEGSVLLLF